MTMQGVGLGSSSVFPAEEQQTGNLGRWRRCRIPPTVRCLGRFSRKKLPWYLGMFEYMQPSYNIKVRKEILLQKVRCVFLRL